MTRTRQVITKRMAQKQNVSITGTAGRVEKADFRLGGSYSGKTEANIGKHETPKSIKKSKKRKKTKK